MIGLVRNTHPGDIIDATEAFDAIRDQFSNDFSIDVGQEIFTDTADDSQVDTSADLATDLAADLISDGITDAPTETSDVTTPYVSPVLCFPCVHDDECQDAERDTTPNLCVDWGNEGKFCGQGCSETSACPEGYSCKAVGIGGSTDFQCLPLDDALCACPASVTGPETECCLENEYGRCCAKRVCGDTECPAAKPSAETCNNVDDNCDGTTDENLTQACQISNAFGTCHGTETCSLGSWVACTAASPRYDSCDGLDNDCDGLTDEEFTDKGQACNSGIGGCSESGTWVCSQDGSGLACNAVVGIPVAETCDGLDNDCDGTTDEDWPQKGSACQGGVGECATTGIWVCNTHLTDVECNAQTNAPDLEICDGLDNDCDALTDEEWPDKGMTCREGTGACSAFGTMECSLDGSQILCDAVAGAPVNEICDGLDNNCDGTDDENWSIKGLPCQEGVGECVANGVWVCNDEFSDVECSVEARPPECEICDGLDNDCDGTTDEDWFDKGLDCHEGVGECLALGVMVCNADGTSLECNAEPYPAVEELCDGLDNDCDRTVDEDFPDIGAGCSVGIGQCFSRGMLICSQDGLGLECGAIAGTPVPELCDALDNNCDGFTDEDFPEKASACLVGIGTCSRTGSWICNEDRSGLKCNVAPGTPVAERCDGLDNDCDDLTDEDFPDIGNSCQIGIGECVNSGTLGCSQDGSGLECLGVAGTPVAELCDGLDNDCDDSTDEDFPEIGTSCEVGTGECRNTGMWVCRQDSIGVECDALTGNPVDEFCDGLDNDCDDSTDEDFPAIGQLCVGGVGECAVTGTIVCNALQTDIECDAVADSPVTELCDGLDNDCDDSTDEDFPTIGQSCVGGIGECAVTGTIVCNTLKTDIECDAVAGNPVAELCDGLDNDCDNSTDEDFPEIGEACIVGAGLCMDSGVFICNDAKDGLVCDGVPGTPVDELCDDKDNDCDGLTDENWPDKRGSCSEGTGNCQTSGTWICKSDMSGLECDAVPGSPTTEVCDNADNNCDGDVDEGLSQTCSISNEYGTCHGTESCSGGLWVSCSAPSPEDESCNYEDDNCDGSTDEGFELATDPFNCGTCGNACGPYDNALTVSCVSSACEIAECEDGWLDLDGIVTNGCETYPTHLWVDQWNIADPFEDGSMAHPFDTLQEAVAVLTAGSTVHIAEGSYIAGYAIPFDAISIIGVGSENVIISVTNGSIGFDLNGSNISISGVSISGGLYGIRATGQSEIHLSDLIVYGQSAGFDQDACGIRIDNCSDVVIANSSFHSIVGGECDTGTTGARGAGICVFASTGVTISGVTAYDIVGGRGEYMGWPNHQGGAGSGVVVDGGASTVTVKDSVFRDILGGPGGHDYTSGPGGRGIGVFVNNGSNTVIRNCLMYNIRGGTSEEGISAYGWGYCAFVATSGAFLLDGMTCVGSGWEKQRGIVNNDGVVGPVAVTNSIFADLPSSCLYNHANNNVTALVASYSDLWDCGTTPAVNSTVLSSCIAVSPEFVDASTNNYHLQPLSPAIDSGKPSSPYCNEPAPNGCRVDMGVYGNSEEATSAPGADHCACCEPDETETEEGVCAISASQTCLGRDDGVICDDGNVCTSFDTCENETCVGRQIAGCQTAPLVIHVQPPASTPYSVNEGSIILDLMTYPVDSSGDAVVPHVPDRDRIAIYMVADKPMMVALVPRGLSGSVILDASSTASYIVRLLVGGWLLPQDMTNDFMSVIASEIDTASLVTAVAEANSINESPFTTGVASVRTDINSSLVTAVQSFELWFAAHPISWTPDDSITTRTNALATATGSISPSGRLGGFKPTPTVDVDFLLTTIHNDRVRPGRAIINRLTPTSEPRVAQEDIPSGRFSYVNTLADLFGGGGGPVEGTTTSLEPVSLSTGPNTLRLSVISSSTTTFIPESSQYHDDFLWAQRQFWWEIVFLPALEELFGFAIGESEFSCAIGLAQYSLELNSLDWEGEDFSFIAVAGLIWDFLQGSDWGTCILGSWSARLIKLAKVAGNLLNIVKVFEYLTNGTMGILSETINAPAGVQWDINVCVPSCDGVTCGDDQCGDNCPDACPAGSSCNYPTSTCQPICECNSALDPCCSDGCHFDGASRVCNPGVATRYTCPNGSCGEDVYVSHQTQYCSGSSAACTGGLEWGPATLSDSCAADERCENGQQYCVPDLTCFCECEFGDCCDGCHYLPSSEQCRSNLNTEYYCKDGIGCGADVFVRYQSQYCSGNSENCDGSLQWGSPELVENCEPNERCTDGDPSCNVSSSCEESCNGMDDNGNGITDDFSAVIPGCFTFVAHHRNCNAHSWYAGWPTTTAAQEASIGNCPPNPAAPTSGCSGCTLTTKYCSVPGYTGNYSTCWSLADGNNFRTYTTSKSAAGVTQLLRHCYNTSSGQNTYVTGSTCSSLGSNWIDGIPATLGYMASSQPSGTWPMTWRRFYVCSYTLGDGFVDHYVSTSCGTHTTVRTLGWAVQ